MAPNKKHTAGPARAYHALIVRGPSPCHGAGDGVHGWWTHVVAPVGSRRVGQGAVGVGVATRTTTTSACPTTSTSPACQR